MTTKADNTYRDILRMIENPKKILGHFLLETLDEENFVYPEDKDMAIRVYLGDTLITKPHDFNTLLTDWVHRWVKQYLDDNHNFSDFQKSVKEEAEKLSKEQTDRFFNDMYDLRQKMEEKFNEAFLTVECLDADQYTANIEKVNRIMELEREVARLKALAGEPMSVAENMLASRSPFTKDSL